MERNPYDLAKMLRDNMPCNDCDKPTNGYIPPCLNTDFCVETPKGCDDSVLTMAFINMQPLDSVYPNETAYQSGTLFPNLDKPFYGGMKR